MTSRSQLVNVDPKPTKIETPTPLFVLRTHRCEVSSLELSSLPLSLFFLSPDHYFNYLQHHTAGSSQLLPPDQSIQVLISGDSTGRVVIWDLELRTILLDFKPHTDVVLNVQLICSGLILLTQGKEGCIKVWSVTRLIQMVYEQVIIEPTTQQYFEQYLLQSNFSALIHSSSSPSTQNRGNYEDIDAIVQQHQAKQQSTSTAQPSKPITIINAISDLLYLDDDDEEEEMDVSDYGFMLADTGVVKFDTTTPITPTPPLHPPHDHNQLHTSQLDPRSSTKSVQNAAPQQPASTPSQTPSLLFDEASFTQCLYKMTLLDIFRHNSTTAPKIMFSFDASIPARLSVLITNSYTFSKMKAIFVESRLISGDSIAELSLHSSNQSNTRDSDTFHPHGVQDLEAEHDEEQVRAFLDKYKNKPHNIPSTAPQTSPTPASSPSTDPNGEPLTSIKITGFDIKQPPDSNQHTSTSTKPSQLPLTVKVQSAILDIGYLFLAPCENASSLKIWRINFSFNLHSRDVPHPTTNPSVLPQLSHSDNPIRDAFCDDTAFEPFHVQTLVIDKADGEDDVAHDSALAELRRLNQFKSQSTLDELELKYNQNEARLDAGVLSESVDDISEHQQLLAKSGLVMHVDVVCLDSNTSLIHLREECSGTIGGAALETAKVSPENNINDINSVRNSSNTTKQHSIANSPPPQHRSLESFQTEQMVDLFSFFAQNNKQVVITALSNLYHQLLLTQQKQHNWLEVHVGNQVHIENDAGDGGDGDSDEVVEIGPQIQQSGKHSGRPERKSATSTNSNKETNTAMNNAKPATNISDTSDLLRSMANDPVELEHLHPPIDTVMEHKVALNSTSSGLAKMLKTRQVVENDEYIAKTAKSTRNDVAMTIKQNDIQIYKLFQIFITYLLQTHQLQTFLHLLFNNQLQGTPNLQNQHDQQRQQNHDQNSNSPQTKLSHHTPSTVVKANQNQQQQQYLFLLSLVTEGGHLLLYQLNLHKMFIPSPSPSLSFSPSSSPSPASQSFPPTTHQPTSSPSPSLNSILDTFFTSICAFSTTNNLAPEEYCRQLTQAHHLNQNTIVSTFKLLLLYLSTSIYSTKHEYSHWLHVMFHSLKHTNHASNPTNPSQSPLSSFNISPFATTSYASLPQHEQNFYRICANFEKLSPTQQKNVLATLPPSMILLLNRVKPKIASDSIVYDQRTILLAPDHPHRQSKKEREKKGGLDQSNLNITTSTNSTTNLTNSSSDEMHNTLQLSTVASYFMLPALFLIRLLALADGCFSTQALNQSIRAATTVIEELHDGEEEELGDTTRGFRLSNKTTPTAKATTITTTTTNLDDIDSIDTNPSSQTSAPTHPHKKRTKLAADVKEFDELFYIPVFTSPTGLLLHRLQICFFYMFPPTVSEQSSIMKPLSRNASQQQQQFDSKSLLKRQFPQLLQYRRITTSSSTSPSSMTKQNHQISTPSSAFTHLSQHLSSVNLLFHQRIIKDALLASTLGNPLVLTPDAFSAQPSTLFTSQSPSDHRLHPTHILSPPLLSFRVVLVGNEKYVKTLTFHATIVPSLTISTPIEQNQPTNEPSRFPPQRPLPLRKNPFARPGDPTPPVQPPQHFISNSHLIIKPTLTNLEVVAQASSSPHHPSQLDPISNQPIQQLLSKLFTQSHEVSIRLVHLQNQLTAYQSILSKVHQLELSITDHPETLPSHQEERLEHLEELNKERIQKRAEATSFFSSLINSDNFSNLLFLLTHLSPAKSYEDQRVDIDVSHAERLKNRKIVLKTGYKVNSMLCLSLMVMQILSTSKIRVGKSHPRQSNTHTSNQDQVDESVVQDQLQDDSNLTSEQLIWSFIDPNNQARAPQQDVQAATSNPIDSAINNTTVIKAGYSALSFSSLEPLCSTILINRRNINSAAPSSLSCIFYASKHIITCGWDYRVRLLSSDIDFDVSLLFAKSFHLTLNHFISSLFAHFSTSITPQLPQQTDQRRGLQAQQQHQHQHPSLAQYAQHQAMIVNWLGNAIVPSTSQNPHRGLQSQSFLSLNHPTPEEPAGNLQLLLDEPLFDEMSPDQDDFRTPSHIHASNQDGASSSLGSKHLRDATALLANVSLSNIETSITAVLDEIQRIYNINPNPNPNMSVSAPPTSQNSPHDDKIDIHREYLGVVQALKAHYKRIGLYIKYLEPFDVVFLWERLGQVKKHIVGSDSTGALTSKSTDHNRITSEILEYYRSQLLFFVSQCYTNHFNAIRASIVIACQQYLEYVQKNPNALKSGAERTDGLNFDPEDQNSMLQQFMSQQSGSQFKDILTNPNADMLSKLTQQDPAALEKLSQRLQSGENVEDIAKELAQLGGLSPKGKGAGKVSELAQLKEMMNPKQYNMTGVTVNILSPGDHLLHYMLCLRKHTQSVMEELVDRQKMKLEKSNEPDGEDDINKSEEDIIRDKLKHMARGAKEKNIDMTMLDSPLSQDQLRLFEEQLMLNESTNNDDNDGALIHNNKLALFYIFDTISTHILPIRPAAPTGPGGMNLSQLPSSLTPAQQNQLQGAMQQQSQNAASAVRFDVESITRHIKLSYLVPYQQHCVGFLKLQQGIFSVQQQQHMEFLNQQQTDSTSQLIKHPRNTAIQRLIIMNKFSIFIPISTVGSIQPKKPNPNSFSTLFIPNISISASILPSLLPQAFHHHFSSPGSKTQPVVTQLPSQPRSIDADALIQLLSTTLKSGEANSISTFLVEQALSELITFFLSSYDITNILSQSPEQRWLEISGFDKYVLMYKKTHATELEQIATLQPSFSHTACQTTAFKQQNGAKISHTDSQLPLQRSLTFASTSTTNSSSKTTTLSQSERNAASYVEISTHQYFNRDIRPNITTIHEYQYKTMVMTMYSFINKIQNHQQERIKEQKKREIRRKLLLTKAKKGTTTTPAQTIEDNDDDLDKIELPLSLSEMRDLIAILQKIGCFCCFYSDIALLTKSLLALSYKLQDSATTSVTTPDESKKGQQPTQTKTKQTRTQTDEASRLHPKQTLSQPQLSSSVKQKYYINRKKLIIDALRLQQLQDNEYNIAQQRAHAAMLKERAKHEKKLVKENKRALKQKDNNQLNRLQTKTGMVIELLSSSSSDSEVEDVDDQQDEIDINSSTHPDLDSDSVPQFSLDNEQEYNTDLDIVSLFSFNMSNQATTPTPPSFPLINIDQSNSSTLSQNNPIFALSLLIHSIQTPLHQDLLLKFHDGQISSFSLAPRPAADSTTPLSQFATSDFHQSSQTFDSNLSSNTSLIECQKAAIITHGPQSHPNKLISLTHQQIQQFSGLYSGTQTERPEMATAGTDGVIAIWKKFL